MVFSVFREKWFIFHVFREGVSTYATQAATYVASFNLAHVILKASDLCFETADSILKWTSSEKVVSLDYYLNYL